MEDAESGWDWFQDRNRSTATDAFEPNQEAELSKCFVRCFGTAEGMKVLRHLRALTVERTVGPHATESLLRYLEGQRQIVLYIESVVHKQCSD